MPRAAVKTVLRLETLASHSDRSVPLISIHSLSRRPIPDPDDPDDPDVLLPAEPRPRPSLQIYYTSPLTTTTPTEELETVAYTLETAVLKSRYETSGAGYERLDVYALPVVTTEEEEEAVVDKDRDFATHADADVAVQRCIAHQRAEIAARDASDGKEWYIQRYDVPKGEWRRCIIVIRTPVAEWEWGSKEKTGRGLVLSTVMFDPTKDGPDQVYVYTGSTEEEIQVLIRELRHELNWQHSYVQFFD